VYSGTYHQRLDAKGRLALPARLREELASAGQGPLVVTGWARPIWLYGPEDWRRVVDQASRMPSQNRSVARFNRYFFGYATEIELDGQGRFLIPPSLRDLAGLQKEVVVAGSFRRIELWDRERWEEGLPTTQAEFDGIDAELSDYNLPL